MVIFNERLAETLGLDAEKLATAPNIFSGSTLPHGANPIAQAYAGYQFGHFAMLGDGRAVLLGEQITPDNRRYDIQLKGSGPTPFSRGGDGYAALLPMLREYIISEAMFALGIPTTRSLAVALTGRDVIREEVLQGAVLTRVASSHIRVGTFNYIATYGTQEDVRIFADYSIRRHFPELENKYVLFFREVAKLQASLIASWQLVGFIHGVMNTDNMAISGETIDYGPCAFMDVYNPETVFSSIDVHGRYAYSNQPKMGAWNLSRLAESLLFLFHKDENEAIDIANAEISQYWKCYNEYWLNGMRAKLGIMNGEPKDADLISELLDLMWKNKLDYTNTFRALCSPVVGNSTQQTEVTSDRHVEVTSALHETPGFTDWYNQWQARLSRQPNTEDYTGTKNYSRTENSSSTESSLSKKDYSRKENFSHLDIMRKNNPAVIPRNHRVEEALAAAEQGDLSTMHNLLSVLSKPFDDSDEYAQPPSQTSCCYKTFCGT